MILRRTIFKNTGAAALLAAIGDSVLAQAGLETTTIVTGFAAGGTSDNICRRIAQKLQPGFARAVVVDNKTGAGGQIAVNHVKGRAADGSTVLQTPLSILSIYPHIYKKLSYNGLTDLSPVSIGCVLDIGFAVGPSVPASVTNIQEFVAWAKANPAGANFGSPAAGATPHFVGALLGRATGVDLKHVAYRGTQPAMLDLLGGNISAVSGPIGDIMQHLPTGKVRILAVAAPKRSRFLPAVPTFAEQGLAHMVHQDWFAFYLPAKASPELVQRLNTALRAALAEKDVVEGLGTFGLDAMSSTPQELADLLKRDTEKWGPLIKEIGFTMDS